MTQCNDLRDEIAEYFESTIREVELIVETTIANDAEFEVVLNERTAKQIAGIKQLKRAGLAKVDSIRRGDSEQQVLTMKQLLDEFCFVVEFAELPFVIKTSRYIESNEIEQFKLFMEWHQLTAQQQLDAITGGQIVFSIKTGSETTEIVKVESIKEEVHARFCNADNLFLDFSSWFAKRQEITRLAINDLPGMVQSPIDKTIKSPLNVKTVQFDWPSKVGLDKFAPLLAAFCSIFDKADKIIVSKHYYGIGEEIEHLLGINAMDSRLDLRASCQLTSKKVDVPARFRKGVYFLLYEPSILNHQSCLHGFSNLRQLSLPAVNDAFDWSLLDSLRSSLECLYLTEVTSLSYKMFTGMSSLKELHILYNTLSQVELDENSQLFADLSQLNMLELDLDKCLLTSGCQIDLPKLKEMWIDLPAEQDLTDIDANKLNLRFNVPELFFLNGCSYLSITALTSIISSLPSVERICLFDPSLEQIKLCLGSFKKLSQLDLTYNGQHKLSQDVFVGMEGLHLLKISDELDDHVHMPVEAFRHLTSLEELHLLCDCEEKNFGIVSQLPSNIKRIYFDKPRLFSCEQFVLSGMNKLVYQCY